MAEKTIPFAKIQRSTRIMQIVNTTDDARRRRVRSDLIAQFGRAGMFLDWRHRAGTFLKKWWPQIVIGIIASGSILFAAAAGFVMEADIPPPTAATVIHHQAPTPSPADIYDGDK